MSDIKTKVQGLDPNLHARDLKQFVDGTANVYESLAVIAKRARQLAVDLKHELHEKLDEFAVNPETIEEVTENKEQIEISKFYERLPNPSVIATEEFLNGEIHFRYTSDKKKKQ
ncbi:MAG TPA: DNA-directed RNA polymerase subunit omega [Saprospiraceae bacterium]|nr:DNA-directed RNA polymerase subunit omega [Saprospiraceae bacterium]